MRLRVFSVDNVTRWTALLIALVHSANLLADEVTDHLVLVVGAAGNEEYGEDFLLAADQWKRLAERNGWQLTTIPEEKPTSSSPTKSVSLDGVGQQLSANTEAIEVEGPENTSEPQEISVLSAKEQLRKVLLDSEWEATRTWLVFIGHGTFANNIAKFNLEGPDLSAEELSAWLKNKQGMVVCIGCFSCSGAFLPALCGANRVTVTATRSGSEINYSRFGKFFAGNLENLQADIDHDREVSLLECFLVASTDTTRYYVDESRLATEHAIFDDNGDQLGTSADFFEGILPAQKPAESAAIDGTLARRLVLFSAPNAIVFSADAAEDRDAIESRIDALRLAKSTMSEDEYYSKLEDEFIELARLYEAAESSGTTPGPRDDNTHDTQ